MSDPIEVARQLLSRRIGFSGSCLRTESIARALALLRAGGLSEEAVLDGLSRGVAPVTTEFEQAVVVGETFFFRERHHFDLVIAEVLPAFFASGRPTLRVWSAGCATGEEAYSLAAMLLPPLAARQRQLSVIGTDLSARSIERGKAASYGRWSSRESSPAPLAMFEAGSGYPRTVRADLRAVTAFAVQNLLQVPPQMADFDVIFCRNALVYFEPESARQVSADLTRRLTPEGLIAFGPMDLPSPPAGAERVPPAALNAWRRVLARRAELPKTTPCAPPALAPPPPPLLVPDRALDLSVLPLHLRALALLEHDRWTDAQRVLEEANRLCPDYLPAILERALIHERKGDRGTARELMRELLRGSLNVEGPVTGPDPLPAEYYRSTAEAFLSRVGGA